MKSSVSLLLLLSAGVDLCTGDPNSIPSGPTFRLRFTYQDSTNTYLGYDASPFSPFGQLDDFEYAADITLDSTTNYLYTPTTVTTDEPSGYALPVFYLETGGADISRINGISSDSYQAAIANGYYPIYCASPAYSPGDATAPLACSVPGTPYDTLFTCLSGSNSNIYAYATTGRGTTPDQFCGGSASVITAFTAVFFLPPPAPSSLSTSNLPSTSSVQMSSSPSALVSSPSSTSPTGVPLPTSTADVPSSTSPAIATTGLTSSTSAGSCPVTFELDIVTTTVTVPPGFSTTSSTDGVASTLNSLSSRYGCAQLEIVSVA